MQVFTRVATLQAWRKRLRGRPLALVPTMGALHDGHLALMKYALEEKYATLATIFVNPKQFNDANDLIKYPRPLAQDLHLLERLARVAVFVPPYDEIYPAQEASPRPIDLGHLTQQLEGSFRPGHFDGVIAVMTRLLDITQPEHLIMGQKDFQQTAIIDEMIRALALPIKLFVHHTLRETDGLAMSSRNQRLGPEARANAPAIYQVLKWAQQMKSEGRSPNDIVQSGEMLLLEKGFEVDYVGIVDALTLQDLTNWPDSSRSVMCIAATIGQVRLIDNMEL